MHITSRDELTKKIYAECALWFNLGCGEVGINPARFNLTVLYNLRGACGGTAKVIANSAVIRINFELAMNNQDEYFNQVIPHEVAHLISLIKYGYQIKGYTKKNKPIYDYHGEKWQRIMTLFGKPATRCHDMNVSETKQKRTVKRYIWECPTCRKEYRVKIGMHKKLQAHNDSYYCNICGEKSRGTLILARIESVTK